MGSCQSSNAGRQAKQSPSTTTKKNRPSASSAPTKKNGGGSNQKAPGTKATFETKGSQNGQSNNNKGNNGKPSIVRSKKGKVTKSAANQQKIPSSIPAATASKKKKGTQPYPVVGAASKTNEYNNADKSKWILTEHQFNGDYMGQEIGYEEEIKGKSIQQGITKFKSSPTTYVAMMYQTSSEDWPSKDQCYTYIHRDGTIGFKPTLDPKSKGWMTLLQYNYQTLKPFPNNVLPSGSKFKDNYTDNFVWNKRKLHSNKNLPILPGT